MTSVPRVLAVRVVGHIIGVAAELHEGRRDGSMHDLDRALGNRNGRFSIGDSDFSASARNIRLSESTLSAELASDEGQWIEDEIQLEVLLPDAPNDYVKLVLHGDGQPPLLQVPRIFEWEGSEGQKQRYRWELQQNGPEAILIRHSLTSSEDEAPRIDLNSCLGNDDGTFDRTGEDFLASAEDVHVVGTKLHARLRAEDGSTRAQCLDVNGLVESRLAVNDPKFATFGPRVPLKLLNPSSGVFLGRPTDLSPLYDPLDRGANAIRLCRIHPGEFWEPIRCTLVTRDDSHAEPYHCLSYVWGDAAERQPILVNGHVVNATINLTSALRQLRLRADDVLYWIDAICINQLDQDEKMWQIGRFADIFRNAERVVCWLDGDPIHTGRDPGLDDEEATILRHLEIVLRHLALGEHLADIPGFFTAQSGTHVEGPRYSVFMWSLVRWFDSPWWHRAWTFQEIITAKSAVFLFGGLELSLQTVLRAAHTLRRHTQHCRVCTEVLSSLSLSDEFYLFGWINELESIEMSMQDYRNSIRHLRETGLGNIPESRGTEFRSAWSAALSIMVTCARRQASDVRDRVYGVLSLMPTSRGSALMTNYNLTTEQVYRDFAIYTMTETRSFDIWDVDSPEPGLESRSDQQLLPSWAIDWHPDANLLNSSSRVQCSEAFLFAVAPSFAIPLTVIDGKLLVVEGTRIDEVAGVTASVWPGSRLYNDTNCRIVFQQWREFCLTNGNESYISGGSTEDAFWKTVICDHLFQDLWKHDGHLPVRRTANEDFEIWKSWVNALFRDDIDLEDISGEETVVTPKRWVQMTLQMYTKSRKMFKTSAGYIGLGPEKMRQGDVLFTLRSGTQWHYLLRPAFSHAYHREDRPVYSLVGPVYVHGIMDGEMFGLLHEASSIYLC